MKNFKQIISIALLVFAMVTIGCKKDIENPKTPSVNTGKEAKLDLGAKVNAKFFGVVKDEAGNPVSDVTISVGDKTATTNDKGIFFVENASVHEKLAYVTAKKTGFFLGSRSVLPSTSATNNISITLLALDIVGTVKAGEEKTISLPNGAAIDFKGSYVDNNGNSYTGTVDVAFKHLPATALETAEQMPGMLYAQNEAEQAGILETYGMVAVELFSSTGEELQLDQNEPATLRMPVAASQLSNAPSTIPLWHFDEVAGYWIEEGEAKLVNGEYVGEVNHFSFWNCDVFGDDAQLHGLVEDQNGNPIDNVSVKVIASNSSIVGTTNSDGTFFTYVPSNVNITLEIIDDCGNSVQSFSYGPYATNSVNNETLVASNLNAANSVQITGTFYDCNNNLVTDGYMYITSGTESYSQVITNGVVNKSILYCNVPQSITYTAYDYTNLQESNTVTTPVATPVTNLGNIVACNTLSEYITYSIDSGANNVISAPINCEATLDSAINSTPIGFYIYTNSFSLNSDVLTIGTHPYGYPNGMTIYNSNDIQIQQGSTPNISFNLNAFGAVGAYVDVNFSGTYMDYSNVSHTISGTIHVLRDN